MSIRRRRILVSVLLLLLAAVVPAGAVEVHSIRFAPATWAISIPADINNAGSIVGFRAESGSQPRGFLYHGGTVTILLPAGWTNSFATGMNAGGVVVGIGDDGGSQKGFIYDNGAYTILFPVGASSLTTTGITDDGTAYGYVNIGATSHGFLYQGGAYTFLLPPGFVSARVRSVNSSGLVLGDGFDGADTRMFLYNGTTFSYPAPSGYSDSRALAINDRGDILGEVETFTPECFFRSGGTSQIIIPPGWQSANCRGLNDNGEIVGNGIDGPGSYRTFIYRKGRYHPMEPRQDVPLFAVSAINDRREVAAVLRPSLVSLEVIKGLLLPEPDLTAKGSDGPIVAPAASPPVLRAAVTAFTFSGRPVEYWLVAQTPAGTYSFDVASKSWRPGLFPALTAPLSDVRSGGLPLPGGGPGAYTYHLGVDLIPNGAVDVPFLTLDTFSVFLR